MESQLQGVATGDPRPSPQALEHSFPWPLTNPHAPASSHDSCSVLSSNICWAYASASDSVVCLDIDTMQKEF